MFVAERVSDDGKVERVVSFENNEDTIRVFSKMGLLRCPECNEAVRYRSGKHRSPHFAHLEGSQCVADMYDRETKEHLAGKKALYQRLKELYPDAKVVLEYKIFETSQRADVIVVHPSGEKWAFEFQCYPISDEVWKSRHVLYHSADIKDFWVLGFSLHKQTEHDRRLKILEHAIREKFGHLIYLDVSTEEFATLEDGVLVNLVLINSKTIRFKLKDA